MKRIKKPTCQLQEVLYMLITRFNIDRRQMMLTCGVLNLPEMIRRLRHNHNLTIELTEINTLNKFGRVVKYGEYSLTDKMHGKRIYNKLQNGTN